MIAESAHATEPSGERQATADDKSEMRALILASASPRRQALLREAGFDFKITSADVDESPLEGERPEALAVRLALAKARAVAEGIDFGLALGADTIVVLDGETLGKPVDGDDARGMLLRLRGRQHLVITGVAVVDAASGAYAAASECTGVWLRRYASMEIEYYIASGDPMDKAGAYAIQHPAFKPVLRLQGSACNVIGLPIALARRLVDRVGRAARLRSSPNQRTPSQPAPDPRTSVGL